MSNKRELDYWLTEEGLLLIEGWARDGLTYEKIAKEKLKISTSTLCVWQHKYPEFKKALKSTGEIADRKVEDSLFKRSTGYNYTETKTTIVNVGGVDEVVKKEVFEKHMPADVTACAIWLNNRKPEQFRRNHNLEKLKEKELEVREKALKKAQEENGILEKLIEGLKSDGDLQS